VGSPSLFAVSCCRSYVIKMAADSTVFLRRWPVSESRDSCKEKQTPSVVYW
jgi:hypothetical protein